MKIFDRPPLVRRPNNKALDERYFRLTIKHSVLVMVWGYFSYYGLGPLVFIDGTLNSQKYEELLKKHDSSF